MSIKKNRNNAVSDVLVETLEELTSLAVKYFSPILNRNLPPLSLVQRPPLGSDEMGVSHSYFVRSIG